MRNNSNVHIVEAARVCLGIAAVAPTAPKLIKKHRNIHRISLVSGLTAGWKQLKVIQISSSVNYSRCADDTRAQLALKYDNLFH